MAIQISINNLKKNFGRFEAIKGLSFDIQGDWQCLGILGRNGAGKTTLLRILVGLLDFDSGTLEIQSDTSLDAQLGPTLAAYIAEQVTLVPSMTGWQHLALYDKMNRVIGVGTDAQLRDDLIQNFSLSDELGKSISKMSKGTKRKLEIIAAASSQNRMVIADELTDGLDIPSRIVLEQTIKQLMNKGKHFFLSSHDLSFITTVCDHVVILDHGMCVDVFSVSEESSGIKERVSRAFSLLPAQGG